MLSVLRLALPDFSVPFDDSGWTKTYGGTDDDWARSIIETSDGGYALAGATCSYAPANGLADFYLVKTDGSGNMQWNRTYGEIYDDGIASVVQTSDGGYALAGYTDSFGSGDEDFYFVKTDSNLGPVHDVAVTNVHSVKTVVGESSICKLNVTVANRGDFIESFNVTAWAMIAPPTTSIQAVSTVNLSPDETRTAAVLWNTTGWTYGNYAVSAYAEPVPGETNTVDNTYIYGPIEVTILGDVDGDFNVDIFDVVQITSRYGKIAPAVPPDSDADIDGNDVVNIFDVVTCTGHYGQKCARYTQHERVRLYAILRFQR